MPSDEMPTFRTILVGTDGSTRAARAVEQAADLAQTLDAALHIVQAHDDVDAVGGGLEALATSLRDRGVTAEAHPVSGRPVPAILEAAAAVGADLIVVGNRGMTGARRILGSVPNTLAHQASCAVLIVHTETSPPVG